MTDYPKMTANDVLDLVQLFVGVASPFENRHQIDLYIDGGWGVDALLGRQTRTHADLDIAVEHKDVAQIRVLLGARGYRDVPRQDTSDYNFVLGDSQGHHIDIHSYTFVGVASPTENRLGNNVYGIAYPFESLTGTGLINGHSVKCISPEWMVKFHCGYEFDENDYRDVKALCQHFEIEMPLEYVKFETIEHSTPDNVI
jgi:lincosamide nucleotidyltransferase A/C/D/E